MLDFTKLVGDEYVHHLLWLIDQPKDQVGALPTKTLLTMFMGQVKVGALPTKTLLTMFMGQVKNLYMAQV